MTDCFPPDDQWRWLDAKEHRTPRWAYLEMEVRRLAIDAVDRVLQTGNLEVNIYVPGAYERYGGFKTVRVFKHDIVRLGGLEQVLLVEEILRREMGLAT